MNDDNPRLTAALQHLCSKDVLVQNNGVEEVIQIGKPAVSALLKLLQNNNASKAQIIYVLAQIGDALAKSVFIKGLQDGNEKVRAYSAQGLFKINEPEAMQACLQTLNDAADELHNDRTPAVEALGGMGLKATPFLLDLLMSEDEMTRLHSQRALELIIMRHFGFQPGRGFQTKKEEEKADKIWEEHGNYNYNADIITRKMSVSKLRQWFNTLTN